MVAVTEKGLGNGLAYVRLLLEERRQQLRALEERAPGHPSDNFSCRRSLEQAIDALEILLRHAEEAEAREYRIRRMIGFDSLKRIFPQDSPKACF